jgi:hypothetical protein
MSWLHRARCCSRRRTAPGCAAPRRCWRAAPKASFYNVQLFPAGKKVLSIWPRGPHLQLTRGWRYLGHSYRLKAGVDTWYVWPGFGPLAKSRYGQLLGRGSFSIAG